MFESVISIITMLAVVAVFGFYFFVKKKEGKDWVYAVYFITVLITGTILYSMGLYYANEQNTADVSLLFVIAQAISIVLKSFGGDFKASAFSALAKENILYQVAVFANFIAAMFLTFLIAIKLFGKNAVNHFLVFVNSFRSKYIVIGAKGQAELFLRSLDCKTKKRTTIVLEAKHKGQKKDLIFEGFRVVVIKDREGAKSSKIKADIAKETHDALIIAGLNRNKKDTKIVALSENDEVNLLVAKIVTDYIKEKINPVKKSNGRIAELTAEQETLLDSIKLSAYIMYEVLDRTEHFAFSEYALGRVSFFNPYEVRARKFMQENPITSLIPKEFINTEKGRLYTKGDQGHKKPYKIGTFFVGYGYTNQYLLKKSICNYQLLGTDYNALIIDKDAIKLEKQFQNSAPGLFGESIDGKFVSGAELQPNPDGNTYYPTPDEKYNIHFVDLNVLSNDFYKRIVDEISGKTKTDNKTQNGEYDFVSVIISLGSDKLSVETALELRQKLYERQLLKTKMGDGEYDRVRIFVKIKQNSVLSDYSLLNDKNDIDTEIKVFGMDDEVLNESYIIDEKLDFMAKRIANEYWCTAGSDAQKTNQISKWDTLTEFKRESNRYAAMSIRTKLNLMGFDLVESDVDTDFSVKEQYSNLYDIKLAEHQCAEKSRGKFVDFAERDAKDNITDTPRNNLARLEHQRWNTLHLLRGWTKLPIAEVAASSRQDEKAKQHACITTFEGLSSLRKKQADELFEYALINVVEKRGMALEVRKKNSIDVEIWLSLSNDELKQLIKKESFKNDVDTLIKFINAFKLYCIQKDYHYAYFEEMSNEALLADELFKSIIFDITLADADTVCYDFDVMDKLFSNLNNSKYALIKIDSK